MRHLNTLAIVVVAVFLIGTSSTEVFAKRPSNPSELEQRVTDLEGQVADHEIRIQNEENNNTGQNQRLDSLEQEQVEQNNRLDVLESQPPTMAGIKVFDSSVPRQLLGFLAHLEPIGLSGIGSGVEDRMPAAVTVLVSSAGKFLETRWDGQGVSDRTGIPFLYFDGPNFSGNIFTDLFSEPPPRESYVLMNNEYYLYEFKDENQIHSFYTIGRYTGENPPVILSRQERGQPCEDPFTYPSGYVLLFILSHQRLQTCPSPFSNHLFLNSK